MGQPNVGIVIVNWNGKQVTLECLESLRLVTYANHTVILVDNGSTDGSREAIAKGFPEVTLIDSGSNLGFSGGNNIGIKRALDDGADAVLLLNNDTVVAPDFLEPLVAALTSDSMIGAVNSKIYYHAEPEKIWSAGGMIDWSTGITHQRFVDEIDSGQADECVDIDYAVGCAVMARREAIERAGVLDDDFFLYYEETEWCQRIRRAGFRIVYVPASRVWHKVSTIVSNPERLIYYYCRNRLLFLKRTGAGAGVLAGIIVSHFGRMAASFFVRGKTSHGWAVVRGVTDYCVGRFGKASL